MRNPAVGEERGMCRVREDFKVKSALLSKVIGRGAIALRLFGEFGRCPFQRSEIAAGAKDEKIGGHASLRTGGGGRDGNRGGDRFDVRHANRDGAAKGMADNRRLGGIDFVLPGEPVDRHGGAELRARHREGIGVVSMAG